MQKTLDLGYLANGIIVIESKSLEDSLDFFTFPLEIFLCQNQIINIERR